MNGPPLGGVLAGERSVTRAVGDHAALVRQQLHTISDRARTSRDGAEERAIRRRALGEATMRALLTSAGLSRGDIASLSDLADTEARFDFLRWLPHAASVGGAAGDASEMSLFGTRSGQARELAALVQMFTLALDGLIDDAPEIFPRDERRFLIDFLQRGFDPTLPAPEPVEADGWHPVVAMVHRIALEWIRRTRASSGWSDTAVAEEMQAAVRAALLAEYGSALTSLEATSPLSNVERLREDLRAKSVNAVLVSCLVPVCVHGWPPNFDRDACRRLARCMGTYVGWIDDIEDVLTDLGEGRWSEVLLDMYVYAGSPPVAHGDTLVDILVEALADEQIRHRLVNNGVRHHDNLSAALADAVSDSEPLMQLIEDVTLLGAGEA